MEWALHPPWSGGPTADFSFRDVKHAKHVHHKSQISGAAWNPILFWFRGYISILIQSSTLVVAIIRLVSQLGPIVFESSSFCSMSSSCSISTVDSLFSQGFLNSVSNGLSKSVNALTLKSSIRIQNYSRIRLLNDLAYNRNNSTRGMHT